MGRRDVIINNPAPAALCLSAKEVGQSIDHTITVLRLPDEEGRTDHPYRMQWHGAHGMPKPQHAHVKPSPEGFRWTATDRYGVTASDTCPDEHTARLAAEAHALRQVRPAEIDVG